MENTNEKQPWTIQAKGLVNYFEGLANRKDDESSPFLLGCFMAKYWLRLLDQAEVNLDEAKLFLRALEAEIPQQGTGWYDLSLRVKGWLAEIE